MVAGLIATTLGIIAIKESIRMLPYRTDIMMGDHIMPAIVGGILIICGLWLAFFATASKIKPQFPTRRMVIRVAGVFLIMFTYVLLLKKLGYPFCTLFASYGLFRVFGQLPRKKAAICAVITTVVVYIVFIEWFGVSMPKGPFRIFGKRF